VKSKIVQTVGVTVKSERKSRREAIRMTTTTNGTHPLATDAPVSRGRIHAWTTAALRDVVYAAAVFTWSIAGFTILVTGAAVTASLLVLVIGIPVWVGFAYVVRWTTSVDRRLAGWQRHQQVHAEYRRPRAPGFVPLLRELCFDPQTWRDLIGLATTSIAGFASGLLAVTACGLTLTYLSMPLWYWAVSHPGREYGITNVGLFTVDTPHEAIAACVLGAVLAPLVLVLARTLSMAHAALVVRVLGRPVSQHAST
jgi:hypothetical protein